MLANSSSMAADTEGSHVDAALPKHLARLGLSVVLCDNLCSMELIPQELCEELAPTSLTVIALFSGSALQLIRELSVTLRYSCSSSAWEKVPFFLLCSLPGKIQLNSLK